MVGGQVNPVISVIIDNNNYNSAVVGNDEVVQINFDV